MRPPKKQQERSLAEAATNKAVGTVNVRPMRPDDYRFVISLAKEHKHFSTPTQYQLWMLTGRGNGIGLIAQTLSGNPLGYLLSIYASGATELFVWQLAVKKDKTQLNVAESLVRYLQCIQFSPPLCSVYFSTPPNSSIQRWISVLCRRLLGRTIEDRGELPSDVPGGEHEFKLSLL